MNYRSLFLVSLVGFFASPHLLLAEEFNPHHLISDIELQDKTTMTHDDIQAFLEFKGGAISHMQAPDVSGTPRLISDMIYRSAQAHNINPKYLLVKLQKEQSLLTEKNPTQKQLDWATGYGICDACSMDDPTLQKHRGIGAQIDSAAGIMRWYYDHLKTEEWIKRMGQTYVIDGQPVVPMSNATGFLYTYTPHIQGNQNFWKLWRTWFAQVYPNGTLVKIPGESTVYVIIDGQRRAFTSMAALLTRFDPKMIVESSAAELAKYDIATPITLPNYAILRNGNSYYLLDNTELRPFDSLATVRALGYNPDEIIDVSESEIAGYPLGKTISAINTASAKDIRGRVIRGKEDQQLYFIKENTIRLIPHEAIYTFTFGNYPVETVSLQTIEAYTVGEPVLFKDGALFGIKGSNKIYVAENGFKRHIASERVFNSLGYDWNNIVWIDQLTGMLYKTAPPIEAEIESTPPGTTPQTLGSEVGEDQSPGSGPAPMIVTPPEKTVFIGTPIETPVNTYLIADSTGTILRAKNIDDPRPIASFTKLMTAYRLAAEGLNTARSVTYDPKVHKAMYNNFRLAPGEQVKNSDLLDALLVSSLNLPAHMLVSSVNKKDAEFVAGMNTQAKTWGLTNTTFADPSGADVENMGTGRDMLTLFQKASEVGMVVNTLKKTGYEYDELVDKDKKPHHYDTHTNTLQGRKDLPFVVLFSKTGYLEEGGASVIMRIRRTSDNKEFTVLTMGNPDYTNRFNEPERLARLAIQN